MQRLLFDFNLLSPFKVVFSSKVYWVGCESLSEGKIIVQAQHQDYTALLKPCLLTVEYDDDKFKSFYIGSGILKIKDGTVSVSAFPIKTNIKDLQPNNAFGFYEAKFLNIWEGLEKS